MRDFTRLVIRAHGHMTDSARCEDHHQARMRRSGAI